MNIHRDIEKYFDVIIKDKAKKSYHIKYNINIIRICSIINYYEYSQTI